MTGLFPPLAPVGGLLAGPLTPTGGCASPTFLGFVGFVPLGFVLVVSALEVRKLITMRKFELN